MEVRECSCLLTKTFSKNKIWIQHVSMYGKETEVTAMEMKGPEKGKNYDAVT